jgi:hypothetical protein
MSNTVKEKGIDSPQFINDFAGRLAKAVASLPGRPRAGTGSPIGR